ncbi:hypothetical protein CEP52_017377 [Fusarium oligoseptatum]|uniref:Uncharacterized protein n=1 Tax=Fusarium oligoseptatum TaxID=2604345 RepID=A0A428RSR1_9HYPO|nr:hypothetical protein CEP52_017377 [Fusarium oligoseptatum]
MEPNTEHTKSPTSCDESSHNKAQVNDSSANTGQPHRVSGDITELVALSKKEKEDDGEQPSTPRREPSINEEESHGPFTSHDMMAIMKPTVHKGVEEHGNGSSKDGSGKDGAVDENNA